MTGYITVDHGDQGKPPHIETENWIPTPGRPGFIKWDSQKKAHDVRDQVHAALAKIQTEDGNAAGLMEWLNGPHSGQYGETGQDFPPGEPVTTVKRGANEGHLVLIMSLANNGQAVTVFTLKYLTGAAIAWQIARALSDAFEIY